MKLLIFSATQNLNRQVLPLRFDEPGLVAKAAIFRL